MFQASVRALLMSPLIAAGVLMCACSATVGPGTDAGGATPLSGFPQGASRAAAPVAGPGEAVAAGAVVVEDLAAAADPAALPDGALYRNPANGRNEVVVQDISRTAVLIGDSQSEPAGSWPRRALEGLGYDVFFCGKGGTGFVASNGATGNYVDALQQGDWHLPYGQPPLVVIEGGGNDAKRGAGDEEIRANAGRLIGILKQRYPVARFAMVGTLAKGADHGGGRRSEVDALLGSVAAEQAIPFVSAGDWLTRYGLEVHLADAVHMNDDGHRALGALLLDRLSSLGLGR